jgi:SRSO17 transposase
VTEGPAVTAAAAEVERIGGGLRGRFRRGAAHRHAVAYVQGLGSEAERKSGWQLAEQAGYSHPRTIQRVLDRSRWDPDAEREDPRAYGVEHLGNPAGVLVVDETGLPKRARTRAA